MKYWMCVTTEENWHIIRDKNVWGVPVRAKNTINKVSPGDKIIIYVIQSRKDKDVIPSRIIGVFEVVSKPYYDEKPIFKSYKGRTFPYRIDIKPIKIFSSPIYFKDIVDEMSFVRNKKFWTVYFRRAMFEIPKNDYEKIVAMGK